MKIQIIGETWGKKAKHCWFVDNTQKCLAFTPQANFPAHFWIFNEGESDGAESRIPFLKFKNYCLIYFLMLENRLFMNDPSSRPAQSTCTHYSCFENQGQFVTLKKKSGTLLFSKSTMQKTRVIVIQKEKRQPGLYSFWITMTLFFCTLIFAKGRVPDISKVPDPKKISGRPDRLE